MLGYANCGMGLGCNDRTDVTAMRVLQLSSPQLELPEPVDTSILVIANACQTVEETLDQFKLDAADPGLLERNNGNYLAAYRQMIPEIEGERREIIDAVNYLRRARGVDSFIQEHNSSSLNGVYLYDFLSRHGYQDRVWLVDNIDLQQQHAAELAAAAGVVLLSTTFITSVSTIVRVCRVLRQWNPRVRIIVGGAKLTQYADDSEIYEAARAADALILSPNGERTLLKVIARVVRGESIADLPNVAYYDGQFRCTSRNLHDGVDIDGNAVHWDLIPPYILRASVNVRTGRGCPFK